MKQALVFNAQRFSLHDGEGIRTTIFFKGCGLYCRWCHNPESQSYAMQVLGYEERCKKCGACIMACPNNAVRESEGQIVLDREKCKACGKCIDYCAYNALEMAGKYYTTDELVNIAKRDMILYEESGGGVTLSGGEAMSQPIEFLLELCKKLKKIGIHVTMDTCGFAPKESFRRLAPYIDSFLYDMKTLDEDKHREFIGEGLDVILDNLIEINKLSSHIHIRIPIIGKFNDDLEEMLKVAEWLLANKIKVQSINLLPYHSAGSIKYQRLGLSYDHEAMGVPEESKMEEVKKIFIEKGFQNIKIGG
ncbi:pyruvate formate lyase activating enzyme [Natronincola peptidivorans]|uniref:Pyruvate formate lyase activating enzyme n=1 Tax=Natronincola peptidivorans TaxID=426128 RepID=A0A1I0FKX8_9FIRM|nr:glycyl-radical enzyme activating protein [Natronincola peptidivorans]SET58721.1 pyruvate formate lyase activating enzyme [Natronincola peptidivorans]